MPEPYPVFHVTCITHRNRPIYPAAIVGRPPSEDYWMGKVTERMFLPLVRTILPEVVDMNMPAEGAFHNLVIVSMKKEYPGQGAQGYARPLGDGSDEPDQGHCRRGPLR